MECMFACHERSPSSWSGSICHLPPIQEDRLKDIVTEIGMPAPIPLSVCSREFLLSSRVRYDWCRMLPRRLLEKLRRKKLALTGTPQARRIKQYSSQSGYVYQYFYEGRER